MDTTTVVNKISECFIKPKRFVPESNVPYNLTTWDLSMLSLHYIQKGLFFSISSNNNDQQHSFHELLESLKESLSVTLVHFYPLAGQLVIQTNEDRQECLVYVDCNKGPGAKFNYATLDMTISDIISSDRVPQVVHSLFDLDRAVNFDGNAMPLLSVQVTKLIDGVFIGCSINHAIVDGTSFWHFWNTWSKIHRASGEQIPEICLPTGGHGPGISLPFRSPDELLLRYKAPQLTERFFHFSSEVIATLKSKANRDRKTNTISSFQALSAFVWKSIVRATCRPDDEVTNCRLAINNRTRIDPPLPQGYFGNCFSVLDTSTAVGELLNQDLLWAASLLNELVVSYSDTVVRDKLKQWLLSPVVYTLDMLDSHGITVYGLPRFDVYDIDFGLGKAVAVRSGSANKFAGAVVAYPGPEGGGSVELEICLPPEAMNALELDEEFMAAVLLRRTS